MYSLYTGAISGNLGSGDVSCSRNTKYSNIKDPVQIGDGFRPKWGCCHATHVGKSFRQSKTKSYQHIYDIVETRNNLYIEILLEELLQGSEIFYYV